MRLLKMVVLGLVLVSGVTAQYQQMTWRTTRGTNWAQSGGCKLTSSRIILTMHKYYIDVEEEAVITASGMVDGADKSSLEITGAFQMTTGSALRSMLLWNGTTILKAKLKDRTSADSAYESVVNREVVRDPAIIRSMGNDWYGYQIFPVALNQSRRIRILYTVPLQAFDQAPSFELRSAFIAGAAEYPEMVSVEFRKGADAFDGYRFVYGNSMVQAEFNALYQIPTQELNGRSYDYNRNEYVYSKMSICPVVASWNYAFTRTVGSGSQAGHYSAIFAAIPARLVNVMAQAESPYTIQLKMNAGSKAYIAAVPYNGCVGIYTKSTDVWDKKVYWSIFNQNGDVMVRDTQTYDPDTATASNALLPLIWAAKYTLDQKLGNLGALYGFVDSKMSLLALEQDTLGVALSADYEQEGVPELLPNEIIINPSQFPVAPSNNVMYEFNVGVKNQIQALFKNMVVKVLPDGQIVLAMGNQVDTRVSVTIYDLGGRLVFTGSYQVGAHADLKLSIPSKLHGCYLMRVVAGKETVERKLMVR